MASARRLYRLSMALGVAGLGAALLALGLALGSLRFSTPHAAALLEACRSFLPERLDVAGVAVLGLAALAAAVLVRVGRSLLRQLSAHRRFMRSLSVTGEMHIGDSAVRLIASPRPQAFCAGHLRPAIYLSTGALERLSREELEAVVAHERHHLRERDPLRILVARVLGDALFFLPALRRLGERYDALAEIAADEAAVRRKGAPTLASALLAFGESKHPEVVVGIAPERVDHLLGTKPGWSVPASLILGAVVTTGGIVALTFAAADGLAGTGPNVAILLAQSCMMAMAGLALAAAVVTWRFSRPLLSTAGR